jgi:hypothetical protein
MSRIRGALPRQTTEILWQISRVSVKTIENFEAESEVPPRRATPRFPSISMEESNLCQKGRDV